MRYFIWTHMCNFAALFTPSNGCVFCWWYRGAAVGAAAGLLVGLLLRW